MFAKFVLHKVQDFLGIRSLTLMIVGFSQDHAATARSCQLPSLNLFSFSCNEINRCCHSFNFRCLLACVHGSPTEEKKIAEIFAVILVIEMRTLAIFMIIGIEMAYSGSILVTC